MEYRRVGTIAGKGREPGQFVESLRGVAVDSAGLVYAVGDSELKILTNSGVLQRHWRTGKPPHCVAVAPDSAIYVGQAGQIEIYDSNGHLTRTWPDADRLGLVTSIGFSGGDILVGDAAQRAIRRFDTQGKFLNDIGTDNRTTGFLTPNGVLDFGIDPQGHIVVANSGKHRVERYNVAGELLSQYGKFGEHNPEDFGGCCNPTNLAVAGDRIVVTEKAGPRVKVYGPDWTLWAVIPGTEFDRNCKNMDVAIDAQGRIYVCETVRLEILVFAPKGETATSRPSDAR